MGIKVPVYRRQVKEQALPNARHKVRVDPGAFGGNVADAAADAVMAGVKVAHKESEKNDAAILQGAYAKAAQLRHDREEEFAKLRGQDAIEHGEGFESDLRRDLETIAGELPADHHREAFQQVLDREDLGFQKSVGRHTAQQSDALFRESNAAAQAMANEDAIRAAKSGDMVAVAEAGRVKMDAVGMVVKHNGLDETAQRALEMTATTELHGSVVGSLIESSQWKTAEEYLSTYRGEVKDSVATKLEATINAAGVRARAQNHVDAIMADAQTDAFHVDLGAALTAARNIEDPELRDEVVQRIRQRAKETDSIRRGNDSPLVAQLDEDTHLGRGWTTSDPRFQAASDEGQATALSHRTAFRNEGRRAQNDLDTLLYYDFLDHSPGQITSMTDADIDRILADGSKKIRKRAKAHRRGVVNDAGVDLGDYTRIIDAAAAREGYDKEKFGATDETKGKVYRGVMKEKHAAWSADPKNQGLKPPRELVSQWVADAMTETEAITDRGFGILSPDTEVMPSWEAKVRAAKAARDEDDDFEITGEQEPAPEPEPEPEGTVEGAHDALDDVARTQAEVLNRLPKAKRRQRRKKKKPTPAPAAQTGPGWPEVLRWSAERAAVGSIDDIKDPTIVSEIVASYRRRYPKKGDPSPAQIVRAFNLMQRSR